MKRIAIAVNILVVLAMVFAAVTTTAAQTPAGRNPAPALNAYKAEEVLQADGAGLRLNPQLTGITGTVEVTVRLSAATAADLIIDAQDSAVPLRTQRAQLTTVKLQQNKFLAEAAKIDPSLKVLGNTTRAMNAVMLKFDGAKLADLAEVRIGGEKVVVKINPVVNYELDMWEVVPYIGAKAVQDSGFTGKGVRVAIIDTGIDYFHYDLYGSGDPADFASNDPTIIEPGTFPTAKVIGGMDFVGGQWPNGDLAPDPDPLDKGTGYPHGTHVASTTGGRVGVAPDVLFYALKVCSSVSSSCSGVAMMQALDWASDPNGDGKLNDRVDIANLSIGSPYGQAYEDDTSYLANQLSLLGTLVVASAGNNGDHPYVTGTIGAALGVLSTAATNNPVEAAQNLTVLEIPADFGAIWQPWSAELTSVLEAPMVYGGSLGNSLGCTPFAAGSLTGKVALVDRGTCAISLKVQNMEAGGAIAAVIGLVAPGDPTTFSFGGGAYPLIPAYNISQADAKVIKTALAAGAVTAKLDPENVYNLAGVVTGYSSRGPSYWTSYLKPDITAPGNSYSAVAGSGDQFEFATGTSFASPTVAGVAALMKQKFPTMRGNEIKALLVGSADTSTTLFSKALAPVSRIGGGEVQADAAASAKAYAYARKLDWESGKWWVDITSYQPSVSFFFNDITAETTTMSKNVIVRNTSNTELVFDVTPTFRYADDELNGAVTVTAEVKSPDGKLHVPATGSKQAAFRVNLTIDGAKLREWGWNTGSQGALGDVFTIYEYDGYIELVDEANAATVTVPWHIVPRQANDISASTTEVALDEGLAAVDLTNAGVGQGYIDSFSLLGESPDDYDAPAMGGNEVFIDLRYFGVATYAVPAGYCGASEGFVLAFAVNLWDRVTHANVPAALEVYIDKNNDGVDDYVILNWDAAYPNLTDGRNRVYVFNLATGSGNSFFYTNHGSNSANMVLYACNTQLGMTMADVGKPMGVSVWAWDNYFTGNYTDAITGLTLVPGGERYYAYGNAVAPGTTESWTVMDTGATGLDLGALLFLDGDMGDVRAGAPFMNEALAIKVLP